MNDTAVALASLFIPIVSTIAFFSFLAIWVWSSARKRERQAYYKSEVLKKLADSTAPAAAATLQYLREQERHAARRGRGARQLGGLITAAVGLAFMFFLRAMDHAEPIYLIGLIPLLIGIALFAHAQFLTPVE